MNANTTVVPTPVGLSAKDIEPRDFITLQGVRTTVLAVNAEDDTTTLVITVPSDARLTVNRA